MTEIEEVEVEQAEHDDKEVFKTTTMKENNFN